MRFTACLIMLAACLSAEGIPDDDPDADSILTQVVDRLPATPLDIKGKLLVRRPRGIPVQEYRFEIKLHWGAMPPSATYTIRNAFGDHLEQLTLRRPENEPVAFDYAMGSPPKAADPPALDNAIQRSDISWMDLSLDFLWWRGGEVSGHEEVKGRDCIVIDVPRPHRADGPDDGYAAVRLWIDRELLMLLQAEGYDADGDLERRLWVKSFKKIDGQWMIKDMEIQSYPIVHRTKLRIEEVEESDVF